MSFQDSDFSSLDKYQEGELLDYIIVPFLILKKLLTVFNSGCTISHSHKYCTRVPISLQLSSTLVNFCLFLTMTILTGVS